MNQHFRAGYMSKLAMPNPYEAAAVPSAADMARGNAQGAAAFAAKPKPTPRNNIKISTNTGKNVTTSSDGRNTSAPSTAPAPDVAKPQPPTASAAIQPTGTSGLLKSVQHAGAVASDIGKRLKDRGVSSLEEPTTVPALAGG